MLIDTHCHIHDISCYTFPMALDMLRRAGKKGVKHVLCISTSLDDVVEARSFAFVLTRENELRREKKGLMDLEVDLPQYPKVSWTFGIHPEEAVDVKTARELAKKSKEEFDGMYNRTYAPEISEEAIIEVLGSKAGSRLAQLIPEMSFLPVAVGEVGLDYHREGFNRIAQIRLLEEMLQIADEYDLPMSFHVREAFDDFFPIVANFPELEGVVHSFSDSKKTLRRILEDTKFYIGVNGMATYSTLPTPPLERTVLETDAPFLTPKPFRDIINEPGYVREVAKWLADKLGTDIKTVERETSKNAKRLFQI